MAQFEYFDEEDERNEKEECPIKDSEACYWLGDGNCGSCYVSKVKDNGDKERVLKNWRTTLSYLPEDIDELHKSETCVLCKGKEPGKREYYVSIDMAHPEPKTKKGFLLGFGKKVRIPVGSIFTVRASCCADCKKKVQTVDMMPIIMLILFFVAGLVSMFVQPFAKLLAVGGELVPILFIVGVTVLGYFVGKAMQKSMKQKLEKEVKINLREIKLIDEMLNNGWFYFSENKTEPKLFFEKKKNFKDVFGFKNRKDA